MSLFICRCLLARFDGRQVLLMHLPLLPNRLPARPKLLYLGLKGQSFVIKTSGCLRTQISLFPDLVRLSRTMWYKKDAPCLFSSDAVYFQVVL